MRNRAGEMVPPCVTPAASLPSQRDHFTRVCSSAVLESQRLLNEKNNRNNASKTCVSTGMSLDEQKQDSTRSVGGCKTSMMSPSVEDVTSAPLIPTLTNIQLVDVVRESRLDCGADERRDSGSKIDYDRISSQERPSSQSLLVNNKNNKNNSTPITCLDDNDNQVKSIQNIPALSSEEKSPVRRVRANHRRNLSLDFRAMGIELPPLPELAAPATCCSPVRRLHNIPESPAPSTDSSPTPAITPKIKHVVRRILSRRINNLSQN